MHLGHFRATVLGNFVKNINLAAGNNVTAVNYLGDWGTQFGSFLLISLMHFLKVYFPLVMNAMVIRIFLNNLHLSIFIQ